MHFSAAKSGRKAVQGTTRPLTIPRREDFALNITFFPSKTFTQSDRLATTVRPCNLRQNRRATGARIWGSVRSSGFFGASVIFLYSYAVNRANFSAQLAFGKITFTNVSFMFGWCEVKNTANVSSVQSEIFTLFRCCKGVSLSKAAIST